MTKKYDIPESEPQIFSEPAGAYQAQQPQYAPYYSIHELKKETAHDDSAEKLEIPNTYEEALSMGVMGLEEAQAELLRYVDQLAEEYHLP